MNKVDILFTIPPWHTNSACLSSLEIPTKQKIFLLSCFPNHWLSNWTAQSTNRLVCLANRSLTGQHQHLLWKRTNTFVSKTHSPPYGAKFRLPTEPHCKIISQVRFVYRLVWEPPIGQSSPKWEKTCHAPMPLTMPNFISVGQTVYNISVSKNFQTKSEK